MTIDKLPSGRYRARVSASNFQDGKRRMLTKTVDTRQEAKLAEAKLIQTASRTTGEGDRQTVAGLVERWISAGRHKRAAATQYKYLGIVGRWIEPHPLAKMKIGKVATDDIERHLLAIYSGDPIDVRATDKTGAATVQQVRGILSGSFRYATARGWTASNPVTNCDPIGEQQSKITAADPAAFRAALEKADDIQPGLAALIRFIGLTGCRRGEALAVRWSDLSGTAVVIDESVSSVPGHGVAVKETKTGRSRSVAVDQSLIDELEQQRQRQLENIDAAALDFDPDGFVWSRNGLGLDPWRPDSAGKWITATGVGALELRHMVATQLLSAGVPLGAVSKRLGHTKTSTTADTYAEALPADDQIAADLLGRLLDEGGL